MLATKEKVKSTLVKAFMCTGLFKHLVSRKADTLNSAKRKRGSIRRMCCKVCVETFESPYFYSVSKILIKIALLSRMVLIPYTCK